MAERQTSPSRPAGFYPRGNKWWWRTDPVTKKPRSSGETDLARAIANYRDRCELAAQVDTTKATASLGHWVGELLAIKRRHNAPDTVTYYQDKLGHALRLFGIDTLPIDITPAAMDAYLDTRRSEGGVTETTLGKEIAAVQHVLQLAARVGAYPAAQIKLLRPVGFRPDTKARERWLTPDEVHALFARLKPWQAGFVAFAIATSARRSEIRRAEPGDVDTERWLVRLRGTKTDDAERVIPIPGPLQELMRLAAKHLPFPKWGNYHRDLEKAHERAGIPMSTPNDWRRTCASWLIQGGVEPGLIARILGHTDSRMVERVYGRMRTDQLARLVDGQLLRSGVTIGVTSLLVSATHNAELSKKVHGVSDGDRTRDNRSHKPKQAEVISLQSSKRSKITRAGHPPSSARVHEIRRGGVTKSVTAEIGAEARQRAAERAVDAYLRALADEWALAAFGVTA